VVRPFEMRTDGLLPKRTKLRSSKYLNNLIEQDHRGIKSRAHPTLGFKNFESAAVKIAGACCLIARASPTHLRPISIFCTRAIYRGLGSDDAAGARTIPGVRLYRIV